MTRRRIQMDSILVNGALLAGIAAILGAYLIAVHNLPSQIYTQIQQQFLSDNSALSIFQFAPIWNVIQPGGAVVPTPTAGWGWQGRVEAVLAARYEERSGVSAPVFDLDFLSEYRLTYPHLAQEAEVQLFFPFPANLETLHDVQLLVDGVEPSGVQHSLAGIVWNTVLHPGEEHTIAIRYRANGATSFAFGLNHDQLLDALTVYNGHMGAECLDKNDGEHFRPAVQRLRHPSSWARREPATSIREGGFGEARRALGSRTSGAQGTA